MDKINNGLKSRELYELISLQPEIIEKLEVIGGREDLTQAERYLDGMMDMDTVWRIDNSGQISEDCFGDMRKKGFQRTYM